MEKEKDKKLLENAWQKRCLLRKKCFESWEEGEKCFESNLIFRDKKIFVKGEKLFKEGNKFWIEGEGLWEQSVKEVYGDVKMNWINWDKEKKSYECYLENGEVFKPI